MASSIFLNPQADAWVHHPPSSSSSSPSSQAPVSAFHRNLPSYAPTPLHSLPAIAGALNLSHVLLKDESNRFGLPSFKILGASWAVYRALFARLGHDGSPTLSLSELGEQARRAGLGLVTCSEGNWGRAVARMARYLDVPARVYVPGSMREATAAAIRGEGADVRAVEAADYDATVKAAREAADEAGMVLVMDMGWEGFEQIPMWVVEGYGTMLEETDRQVLELTCGLAATHAIVPVGVGSIAHAVTEHYKSSEAKVAVQRARATVVTVEADTAAGLKASLEAGSITVVPTAHSIMCGMNCGTVSTAAWPTLKNGVDASVVVTDEESHKAVEELESAGIHAGPCGAATLAALRRACLEKKNELGLAEDSVAVLFCTEGKREYDVPS